MRIKGLIWPGGHAPPGQARPSGLNTFDVWGNCGRYGRRQTKQIARVGGLDPPGPRAMRYGFRGSPRKRSARQPLDSDTGFAPGLSITGADLADSLEQHPGAPNGRAGGCSSLAAACRARPTAEQNRLPLGKTVLRMWGGRASGFGARRASLLCSSLYLIFGHYSISRSKAECPGRKK